MKKNDMFPSKFLKAEDLGDEDHVVTISRVEEQDVGAVGKKENKAVVYFDEFDKGLVLNKTNWNTIEALTGHDDTDDWTGAKVTLYATEVEFQGDMVLSIRVRLRKPSTAGKPAKAPSTSATDLEVIKAEAWKALKAKYPTVTDNAELLKILAGHVAEFYEGQKPATIGVKQYRELIDNGFDADRLAMAGGTADDELPNF